MESGTILPPKKLIKNKKKQKYEIGNREASNWYIGQTVKSNKMIRKHVINEATNYRAIYLITKLRTGIFTFTNQMNKLSYLLPDLYGRFIGCDHLLLNIFVVYFYIVTNTKTRGIVFFHI